MGKRRKISKVERPKELGFSGNIIDLHSDVLKEILICVAKSSDGAKSLVKAMSTALRGLVEDGNVLKAVAFDKLLIPERYELFQHTGGLVTRCARAGHEKAKFILAEVIIVSSSKLESLIRTSNTDDDLPLAQYLKQRTQSVSFIKKFIPNSSGVPQIGLNHCDLVFLFLSHAKITDFVEILPYFPGYLQYLFGSSSELLRFPYCQIAHSLSTMLRQEPEILGICKTTFDRAFALIRDCKLKDEHALTLMRDCKLKHQRIFVQLAEVRKKDLCDANFYSLEFYEAVFEVVQTIRAAMEKESPDVALRDACFHSIAPLEILLVCFRACLLSYKLHAAEVLSAFDQFFHG